MRAVMAIPVVAGRPDVVICAAAVAFSPGLRSELFELDLLRRGMPSSILILTVSRQNSKRDGFPALWIKQTERFFFQRLFLFFKRRP
jgi:hypothetical protein